MVAKRLVEVAEVEVELSVVKPPIISSRDKVEVEVLPRTTWFVVVAIRSPEPLKKVQLASVPAPPLV